jgi:adenylate kinase
VCDRCGGELYQRTDDAPEVVGNRVDVYLRDTRPVIDHYEALGLLRTIDGNREIETVKHDLAVAAGKTDAITA